ncbi:MAG: biotin--[acetyl-CoA-carboxylase] ligase [Oligoflexales bacterium]
MIPLQVFNTLDSTSNEARRQLEAGVPPSFAIRARQQTQGRGTQGRQWLSGEGSLALTLVCSYTSHWAPSLQAGVIVAEWLERCVGLEIGLKWPNDLMVRGEKIGGILCETHHTQTGSVLMIGIGINLKKNLSAQESFTYQVSSLEEQGVGKEGGRYLDLDRDTQSFLSLWEKRWNDVSLPDYLKWSVSLAQPYYVDGKLEISKDFGEDGAFIGKHKAYYSSQGLRWAYQKPSVEGLWIVKEDKGELACFYFRDPWGQTFERISVNTMSQPPCVGWPLYVVEKGWVEPSGVWEVIRRPALKLKEIHEIRDVILR